MHSTGPSLRSSFFALRRFDFAYLTKRLLGRKLPEEEADFFELLKLCYPTIYDLKYLMRGCNNCLHGGLQDIADQLGVERTGIQHQAGSDSLLTGKSFFQMRAKFFPKGINDKKYNGYLYGFSQNYQTSAAAATPTPT